MNRERSLRLADWSLFLLACAVFFLLCTYLFYHQTIKVGYEYPSDLNTHIEVALERRGRSYSLQMIIFYVLYRLFRTSTIGIAIYLGGVEVLTVFAVWYLLTVILTTGFRKQSFHEAIMDYPYLRWISLASMFLVSFRVPVLYPKFYAGAMVMTSWHNDTYITMRLFSVLALAFFFRMVPSYLDHIRMKDWILFCFFLTAATGHKPSFVMGFAPMAALMLLADLIRSKGNMSKFRNIIILGCAVLPSVVIVYFQNEYTKTVEGEAGILFSPFTVFAKSAGSASGAVLKFVCFILFPLIITIVHHTLLLKKEGFWFRQIWIMWAAEMFYYLFLAEGGVRMFHGNFAWGTLSGNYLLYLACILLFLSDLKKVLHAGRHLLNTIYVVYGIISLVWMEGNGLWYFWHIVTGHHYYI